MCFRELKTPVAVNVPLKVFRTVFRLSLKLFSYESYKTKLNWKVQGRNNVNSAYGQFGALALQRRQLTWQLLYSNPMEWGSGKHVRLSSSWERMFLFCYSDFGFLLCSTYSTQWAFPSRGSGNWVADVPAAAGILHPFPKFCCLYENREFIWLML